LRSIHRPKPAKKNTLQAMVQSNIRVLLDGFHDRSRIRRELYEMCPESRPFWWHCRTVLFRWCIKPVMLDWLSWRLICSAIGLMLCHLLEGRMNIKKKMQRRKERLLSVSSVFSMMTLLS